MSAPGEGQDVSVQNVRMDGQYAMRESGVNLELGILENLEWRYARLGTFRIALVGPLRIVSVTFPISNHIALTPDAPLRCCYMLLYLC